MFIDNKHFSSVLKRLEGLNDSGHMKIERGELLQ